MPSASLLRILVVEDNPVDLLIAEDALTSATNLQLICKNRLKDALEVLAAKPIDAILLDLGLPDCTGLDTLRRVKQCQPEVTVIVLTGQNDEDLATQAMQAGAQDVLSKGRTDFGALERLIRYAVERKRAVAAVQQSEERFRILVEGVRDHALVLLGPEGQIVTWNTGASHILGYEEHEIMGQSYSCFYTPEDVECGLPQRVLDIAKTQGQCTVEGWRLRRDGSRYWSNGTVRSLFTELGVLRGFAIVTRDLTDRRRAEDALRESEERFRILVEHAADGIFLHAADGTVLDVNRCACDSLGYTREELVNKKPSAYDPSITRDDLFGVYQALENGEVVSLETQHRRKDGSTFPVEIRIRPFRVNDNRYSLAIVRDVTDRKRAESALRESEERFRTLIESLPDAICINSAGRMVYCNPAFADLFGARAPTQLLGKTPFDLHPREYHQAIERRLTSLQARVPERRVEEKIVRLDGRLVPVLVTWVAITDSGNEAILIVFHDLTEQNRLGEQLRQSQKMEAVGQMAGGIAHDFNNILTVINGYGGALAKEIPAEGMARQWVTEMMRAGERAAALTRQLLTFSRQQPIAPVLIDLNQLVGGLLMMLRRVIGEDLELVTHLHPGLWKIRADPGQIEQVIINLVLNARDAMPSGGTIAIQTSNIERGNLAGDASSPWIQLTICDDGVGMTEEVKARIFEPYFTTKGLGKGTGLGLAIVFGVIRNAGGKIEVESDVGVGSIFRVYFPPASESATTPHPFPRLAPLRRRDATILLVEDDEAVRALLAMYLLQAGYRVLASINGVEAIKVADTFDGPIHLLISDVVMPLMGGRELADRLLAVRPSLKVLFLSGYTGDTTELQGIRSDQVNLIQKPVGEDDLFRKVQQILGSKW